MICEIEEKNPIRIGLSGCIRIDFYFKIFITIMITLYALEMGSRSLGFSELDALRDLDMQILHFAGTSNPTEKRDEDWNIAHSEGQ